ncbi:ISAs1 family transposase [Riemerella columbina]|uniref:ISAs1 family transposase n=1 Tax=Riemerella columbina TaxID=103810 RepID=UPI0003725A14|nr:ISAs1 family transposase [Riemerella columbina]
MEKLIAFAKSIDDFRLDRRKRHPVENIVFITIIAVICDASDWEEIEDFALLRKDYFSKYLNLENGIPSHDTFNRFFSLFNPKKFQNLFIRWVQELLDIKLEAGFQVAIDGKSSRNTVDAFGNMLHLLNAYLVEERCILGQHKTDDKSNEVRAIPILLEVLDLKDAIISIDAMGCQKEIVEKIIDQKADYFLALKKNQKTLYEDIETAFLVFNEKTDSEFITEEINGSRVEKRICKVMDDLSHLSTEFHWKGLRKIVKIETETYLKSKQSTRTETRYYITSKDITAERFLQISRNHWMIENKLHWSLDVIMQEDKSRKRNNNVAENFSILLKVILKLLQEKQLQNKRISVKFHNIIDGILSS